MTSNLVNMDTSSASSEVNNNNTPDNGGKNVFVPDTEQASSRKDDDSSSTCTKYILTDSFGLSVRSSEEWLCVARMPLDFTQTEFESLLDEFGPIQQCFLIHSEITGLQVKT